MTFSKLKLGALPVFFICPKERWEDLHNRREFFCCLHRFSFLSEEYLCHAAKVAAPAVRLRFQGRKVKISRLHLP